MSDHGKWVSRGKGIRFRVGLSDNVPVIDFSRVLSGDLAERKALAKEIREAATNVGFFYLSNHGISETIIENAKAAMAAFFDLPHDEKMKIHYKNSPIHRGYVGAGNIKSDREKRGTDMHEAIELAEDLPDTDPDYLRGSKFHGPNIWPEKPPEFRDALATYFEAQLELGRRMLSAFALALDLDEDFFEPLYTRPMSRLRACFYPPQDPDWDIKQLGIGAHKDFEIFTTVWADQPGLQVLGTHGDWIDIQPKAGTFVINIGDLMQRWTNDIFLSRPHRVINLNTEKRYSLAQFFGVDYDVEFDAFPTIKAAEQRAKYPSISCGAHIEERVGKAYYSET